jgi:RNA recognition motif-containing protein
MGTRVYVGRISYDVRERDIEKFFKGYGRIREILMKDGFAFVVILLLLIMVRFNLIFVEFIGIR